MEGKNIICDLGDRLFSEECSALKTPLTQFISSCKQESTVRVQSISVLAVAEYAVKRLFGDIARATELRPNSTVLPVISTVTSRPVAKDLQSYAFHVSLEMAVQKWLAKLFQISKVATRMIAAHAFIIPVAKLVKCQVEKYYLEKIEKPGRHEEFEKGVDEQKKKEEDNFPPVKNLSNRMPSRRWIF